MNNRKYKNKIKISNKAKSILVTIGMILLIFALLAGINAIRNNQVTEDGYEVYNVTWKSGGIDSEDGSMVIDEEYMYSSAIKVDTTLLIRREYDSNVAYVVFYYNELGELLYKDNETTHDYTKSIDEIVLEDGEEVDHARILVRWLENDDDELTFFERFNLSNKINVFVGEEVAEDDTTVEETEE